MKNHDALVYAGCFALSLFLSLAGQAQTTNLCDGCTISSTYTNLSGNYYNLIGTNTSVLTGVNTTFFNQGTVQQTGSGSFLVGGYQENSYFNNGPGATYQFVSDSVIGNDFPGYSNPVFTNAGLVWKSGGTNISAISISFNNEGGVVQVDSGTLTLNGGGTSSNGVFNVASGAMLDLTGGNNGPTWSGDITGNGSGQIWLDSGTLYASPSLVLAFPPGLFQWNGGTLQGIITNTETVTVSGTNVSTLTGANTTFVNEGMVTQTGSGGTLVGSYGANVYFTNEPGATYQFASDSSITFGNNFYGQTSASVPFLNQGLVWKSGGTNTSAIGVSFNNLGGTVKVDSGTLTLYGGGTSSNGVFNVASGAVLDLTGGANGPMWSGTITGSGSGQVWLDSGTLYASPSLVLASPPGLFQWNGGTLQGIITNTGTVTISGTNVSTLTGANTTFVNEGMVTQTGSGGTLMGSYGANVYFTNEPGGTYQFASDSSIGWGLNFYGQGPPPFYNQGLVWKSAGTNTSTIYPAFVNNFGGSIEVDSGVLALYGVSYPQNSGTLTIGLGGSNTNQCGQLAVGGPAALNGPLKVILTNGYVPVVGDQFEILSCSSFTGVFSSTNVPAGMTVSYVHNNQSLPEYVYLVVTGTVPAQIQSPGKSGGIFKFSFGTANGQSYTVQQNTNLTTANWTFYTNITGNGSIYLFTTPVANIPQRFFRVGSP
jgi:hypothetical protein